MRRAVVIGTGAHLPKRVMTNHDFAASLDTSDEWIQTRTGIRERHIAGEGETTSTLAIEAGKQALANAGIAADSIDLVIVATTTPDDTMPSTATKVQHGLGITRGAAFDVNAACSGFVYAMATANAFISSGLATRVLVVGAETFSRILDWNDRGTCILFGDGAAAVVLEAQENSDEKMGRGILHSGIYSDGQYTALLNTTGGVSSTQQAGTVFMAGKDIFRHASSKMPEAVIAGMKHINMPVEAIDWLVPHQANMRILASVAQKLEISEDKVIATVAGHANTSAASIPLALHQGVSDGRIKKGDIVACPALGAGLTWGATIIRW